MTDQYSPILALDSGSPIVSVAVAIGGQVVGERVSDRDQPSVGLLSMIDDVLAAAGLRPRDLEALLGLRGPGSFTGLRVGLATLQGLRQALAVRAGTLGTLEVLAALAPDEDATVVACVDALREQWLMQPFRPQRPRSPLAAPRLCSTSELLAQRVGWIVGFGASRLRDRAGKRADPVTLEPGPLAAQALRLLPESTADWSSDSLTRADYLRPPAARRPGSRA